MARKNTYGVLVPTSELRKLGVRKLNIRNFMNRNDRKVRDRTAAFEMAAERLGDGYTVRIGSDSSGRLVGMVYRVYTNKAVAAKEAAKLGYTRTGFMIF